MSASPLSVTLLSHVASSRAPTGAERSLVQLAAALRERGHHVEVVAPGPWALAEELERAGVPLHVRPTRPCWLTYHAPRSLPEAVLRWLRWARPPRGERALRRLLRERSPRVVHVNTLPHLSGARAAAAAGIPVVWHVREILPAGRRRRWFAAALRRHAASIVAVSEATAEGLRAEGLPVRVVPNGVAAPAASGESAADVRARLGLEAAGVWVGLFGQLVPHKGALAFVEAAARAAEREPSLRFAIAGPGPDAFRARVARAADERGLSGRLRLLASRPTGDELVRGVEVVCLATTTPDPFPRAVLEAMAHGKPVAAFRSGGAGEMVVDGATGLLVPPGDVGGLADAFVRLAGDAAARSRLGDAGAQRVREEFSLDRHVETMEDVLRGVAR